MSALTMQRVGCGSQINPILRVDMDQRLRFDRRGFNGQLLAGM